MLKSFGYPLIIYSLFNFLFYLVSKGIKGNIDLSNFYLRFITPYTGGSNLSDDIDYVILFGGCWFLFALFLCRIFIGDIKFFRIIRENAWIVLIVLCVYLSVEPYLFPNNPLVVYKIYRVVPSLPFVLVGFLLKERLDLEKLSVKWVMVMFLIFCLCMMFQGYCNILDYKFGVSYVVFFFNAILGALVLFKLCTKLKYFYFCRIMSVGTLFVLAFNMNLIRYINAVLEKLGFGELFTIDWLFPWIVGLFIIVLCFYPIKFLLKYYPKALGRVSYIK